LPIRDQRPGITPAFHRKNPNAAGNPERFVLLAYGRKVDIPVADDEEAFI
jgi:hypothetical protein